MQKKKIKIIKIEVSKLFGLYNYVLQPSSVSKFAILYGDNGSGKTSILNCIFHILHPEPKGGHRTAIGNIPFQNFEITFSNNDKITLSRKNIKEKRYTLTVEPHNIRYVWDPEKDRDDKKEKDDYNNYCKYLAGLNFNTLFLTADRKVYSEQKKSFGVVRIKNELFDLGVDSIIDNDENTSLTEVIESFCRWMHRTMIQSTDVGNKNITDHYLSIMDKIVKPSKKEDVSEADIKGKIEKLEEKSKEYLKYGLTVELFPTAFKKKLENIKLSDWNKINPVIDSYLSTLELRLNALSSLQDKLNQLDTYINSFFRNKQIIINAMSGIKIISSTKDELKPEQLSSGEKQILYLFCKVVSATEKSLIVMIDEPEISLNIKWQRRFIEAINSFIGNNDTQVIIASHSIDLINPYIDSVVKLENKK